MQLLEVKASSEYIDQKRAGLAAIAAGQPHRALRVFLAGRLPPPPVAAVAPGAAPPPPPPPSPPSPLLIFHIVLFDDKLEAYTVDKDLHPLQELRAHIPAYLGEAATGAMRGGPWRCRLTDFAKSMAAPGDWKANPPDIENDVWRIVLATKFGDDAHHGFTMERVPADALYSDAYRLHAIREITIAVFKACGVLDVDGDVARPLSPGDILGEALDRHAVHGMLPSLRANVCVSTHTLLVGLLGEYGAALASAKSSRDCAGPFLSTFVRYPSRTMSDWQEKTVVYENMAERRRGESLAQGGVDGMPIVTFPPPGWTRAPSRAPSPPRRPRATRPSSALLSRGLPSSSCPPRRRLRRRSRRPRRRRR